MNGPSPAILFQDRRFVVLDKPVGLAVHAGPSGGRSVEDWFRFLSRRKDGPWLPHRLDADSAGCLVVALQRARRSRRNRLRRECARDFLGGAGAVSGDAVTVSAPLRRVTSPQGWRMVADLQRGRAQLRIGAHWVGRRSTWLEMRPGRGERIYRRTARHASR
jgi:tRNA pseudouridine32 synthase/23S rRNA pseudouridine746 synthase